MSLTFRQGTKVILDTGTNRYVIPVSAATASQTYVESNKKVKTLHSPNLFTHTFATEKSSVALSFSMYVGSEDMGILEWFGFALSNGRYINTGIMNLGDTPKQFDIYIDAGYTVYKVKACVGQNISLLLDRKNLLTMSITGVGEDIEATSLPSGGIWKTQDTSSFYNAPLTVSGYPDIVAVTCEITRNISWVRNKSTHDIGSIYKVNTPIIQDMSISGSITKNKTNNNLGYLPNESILISYGSTFKINMDACNTTDRWDMSEIHKVITDYKVLPTAVDTYITF